MSLSFSALSTLSSLRGGREEALVTDKRRHAQRAAAAAAGALTTKYSAAQLSGGAPGRQRLLAGRLPRAEPRNSRGAFSAAVGAPDDVVVVVQLLQKHDFAKSALAQQVA